MRLSSAKRTTADARNKIYVMGSPKHVNKYRLRGGIFVKICMNSVECIRSLISVIPEYGLKTPQCARKLISQQIKSNYLYTGDK